MWRFTAMVFGLLLGAGCSTSSPTERPYSLADVPAVRDPQFRRMIGSLLGPPISEGNQTITLLNGDRIFSAMLESIRAAKRTINFETFVYWSGKVGSEFANALSEAAARGVQVRVILDSIGSDRIKRGYINQMRKAGAKVVEYHPLHWFDPDLYLGAKKFSNRTHRKLLIVDGQIGFTGGVGIADEWMGDADAKNHWRDTHYQVVGPVVGQLQAAFVDNWMETTGEVLKGDAIFPPIEFAGQQSAQVFRSSPNGGSESMELLFLLSIAAARQNVRLASAYFVPDQMTVQALTDARRRGVRVQIIVPGREIDVKVVRSASRAEWGPLLRAGVQIYEYQPTMYHVKQLIIDDIWVSIGSANLDNRSFQMNDEANLNVMDEAFAREQIRVFEEDLARSHHVTHDEWEHRPAHEKLVEFFTWLFAPLM
jgi:cardiolipin synthase